MENNWDLLDKDFLKEKYREYYETLNKYNDFIKLFKSTGEKKYIKEAVNVYLTEIKELDNNILELNYKYNNIESDDLEVKLIQNKYDIRDLELVLKPELKS